MLRTQTEFTAIGAPTFVPSDLMCRATTRGVVAFVLLVLVVFPAAADRYVWKSNSTPVAPYATWDTAAQHIQEAVDVAAANETVWIRAGRYTLPPNATNYFGTNVVFFSKPLTLRSETDDPADVVIDGEGAYRLIAAVNTNTPSTNPYVIRGLTVTNGYAFNRGGGILFYPNRVNWPPKVLNCVVVDNTVVWADGTTGQLGAGAYGGGICHHASYGGGSLIVSNTVLRGNLADGGATAIAFGGGLYSAVMGPMDIRDCLFEDNTTQGTVHTDQRGGGGMCLQNYYSSVLLERLTIRNNRSGGLGGGVTLWGNATNQSVVVRNCLLVGNEASWWGGGVFSRSGLTTVHNTTIADNSAGVDGGGWMQQAHAGHMTMVNTIIHGNTPKNLRLNATTVAGDPLTHWYEACCTTPLTGVVNLGDLPGEGNFDDDPGFAGAEAGNYRLTRASSCVDRGVELGWMATATDLDGHPRIDRISGKVDVGCYELTSLGSLLLLR